MAILQRLITWIKSGWIVKHPLPLDTLWVTRTDTTIDDQVLQIHKRDTSTFEITEEWKLHNLKDKYTFFQFPSKYSNESIKGLVYVQTRRYENNKQDWHLKVAICRSVCMKTPMDYFTIKLTEDPTTLYKFHPTYYRDMIMELLAVRQAIYGIGPTLEVYWYAHDHPNPIW